MRLSIPALLFGHLPPVSAGRLILPVVFIGAWTLQRGFRIAEALAIVWAGVLAQATQIWVLLPASIALYRQNVNSASQPFPTMLTILATLMALQVWIGDPLVSQRIVSGFCAPYIAMMAWGVMAEPMALSRFVPMQNAGDVPLGFHKHLLKHRALVVTIFPILIDGLITLWITVLRNTLEA